MPDFRQQHGPARHVGAKSYFQGHAWRGHCKDNQILARGDEVEARGGVYGLFCVILNSLYDP